LHSFFPFLTVCSPVYVHFLRVIKTKTVRNTPATHSSLFLFQKACTSGYTFRSFAESSSFFSRLFSSPPFLLYVVHITVCVIYKLFHFSLYLFSFLLFFRLSLNASSSFSLSLFLLLPYICIFVLHPLFCFSVIFLHVRMQFPQDDPLQNKQTKKSIKSSTNKWFSCSLIQSKSNVWQGCQDWQDWQDW